MSGNTEPTSNSMKMAPMPLSALLANLMPFQSQPDSPDDSYMSVSDSDESFGNTVAKKTTTPLKLKRDFSTPSLRPSYPKDIKAFSSERKTLYSDHNKENADAFNTNITYANKDLQANTHSGKKTPISNSKFIIASDVKKRSLLLPPTSTTKSGLTGVSHLHPVHKRTPDLKPPSANKLKSATPKIKSGIRKFTPGSGRHSNKKPLNTLVQNRDKVRIELFSQKTSNEPQKKPEPVSHHSKHHKEPQRRPENSSLSFSHPSSSQPASYLSSNPQPAIHSSSNLPPSSHQPTSHPSAIHHSAPNPAASHQLPIPETPSNKPPPMTYAATPSYPQGMMTNNAKVLFKTTSIKDKKYMFVKKLGTGGSSEVYKVLEVGTSCEYAVKCVQLGADKELAQGYINEVRLLRELQNSDRVVKLIDYEYDRANQFLRLVLEVGETDLSSFLKARGGLSAALVLHYWAEMLHAVHYIHDHGVIHADLKPANFLLVSGQLKLIDFGIASAVSSDATSVVRAQAAGTYSYISPEALMGGAGGCGGSQPTAPIKISFRSDVWSLGCILYSMVYGRTPFSHIPNLAKLAAILDPNHRIDYPPADHVPQSLLSAMRWCLTYNARARPTVQQLLNIEYLQHTPQKPLTTEVRDKAHQALRAALTAEEYALVMSRL